MVTNVKGMNENYYLHNISLSEIYAFLTNIYSKAVKYNSCIVKILILIYIFSTFENTIICCQINVCSIENFICT